MKLVAVDPGVSGAVAVFDGSVLTAVHDIERLDDDGQVDPSTLLRLFQGADMVVIERVHAVPRDRPSTAFKFGAAFGCACAIARVACFDVRLVSPQVWKPKVLGPNRGVDRKAQKKAAVDKVCSLGYRDLLIPPRGRVPSADRADSVCIGLYAIDMLLQ